MEILNLNPDVVRQFRENDTILACNGSTGSFSALDHLQQNAVREFEQQWDNPVYLVVRLRTLYGLLDSLLFVGNYPEEWEYEREDLKSGYAMTYTVNQDYPDCSDMGSIVVRRTNNGGLARLG